MKAHIKTLLTLLILFCSVTLFAQDKKAQADTLIRQGTYLHDARKYDEAIAKYDEALKLDPENQEALFEKAFTLTSSGKPDAALPLLEKVAAGKKQPGAFDILGTIYDNKNQFETAQKYYKQGITVFPKYFMLHYNLSVSYAKQQKWTDSKLSAVEAIKLNPRHASSHRAFAMASLGEGNKAASLLGWCSFLLIEPQTARSAEAIKFVKSILHEGIQTIDKNTTLSVNVNSPADLSIKIAVMGAVANKTGLSPVDSLQLQLGAIFQILHEQKDLLTTPFLSKYLGDYFNALAVSGNMPTYAHFITMTTNRDEDKVWFTAHSAEVKSFSDWVKTTKREFE